MHKTLINTVWGRVLHRISVVLISKFLGACGDCDLESFYIFQMIQSFEVAYQDSRDVLLNMC